MQDTKDYIQAEILRKLATARRMIDFDKEIAAGIYMYALEELGKLEVLKRSEQNETQYNLKYEEEFLLQRVKHKYRWPAGRFLPGLTSSPSRPDRPGRTT